MKLRELINRDGNYDEEKAPLLELSENDLTYYEIMKKVNEEIAEYSLKITLETLYNLGLENANKK